MKLKALLPVLLVVSACGPGVPDLSREPSRFTRTDPKNWTKLGWEGVRWGMGPGDVEVHLGPKGMKLGGVYEQLHKVGTPVIKYFALKDSERVFAGEKTVLIFGFISGALYSVVEQPARPGDDFQHIARWVSNARAELANKWGEPKLESGKEYLAAKEREAGRRYGARWESERFTGGLVFESLEDPEEEQARVQAVDPKRSAAIRDAARAASAEKQQGRQPRGE